MLDSKKRNFALDIARTFAIICVVLCHSVESVYKFDMQEWNAFSIKSNLFKIILFTIGRLGVPLFLLLTGYLTLNKNIKNDDDGIKFYKKNLIPIIITTEVWIVIYTIFLCIINEKQKFSFEILIRRMLFFEYEPSHMWYMPMIIGIYLAVPFINNVLKNYSIKIIKIPLCIIILSTFIIPTINNILKVLKINTLSSKLDLEFLGASYGAYIIIGYFVSKEIFKKVKSIYILLGSAISFILCVGMQVFMYKNGISYKVWYNSIFILIMGVGIFELCTRVKEMKLIWQKIFMYISKISFSIFFVHKIIQICLERKISSFEIGNPFKVISMFFITFILCIIFISILSKIKWIKQKIFLIKD